MIAAAQKAGRKLVRDFGEVENLQVSKKGPADFVSNADRTAEDTLRYALEKVRPEYSFLLEESGELVRKDTSNRWIIDPLDGTTNFLHGIPHFAISIALERDGELFAGVIYEPVYDQMYWARARISTTAASGYPGASIWKRPCSPPASRSRGPATIPCS
jgi:myo-inositol-1(or 4)-monophosphatase